MMLAQQVGRLLRIVLLVLIPLLTSCRDNSVEGMLNNYLERVANTLQVDYDDLQTSPLPLFPYRRERILATEELRQSLTELFQLKACDLLPLIAERNSSMGKVAPPSQKLVYELNFWYRLKSCDLSQLPPIEGKKLAEQLQLIRTVKSRNLNRVIWNALYSSKSLEANFARGKPPLSIIEDGSSRPSITALEKLSLLAMTPWKESNWQLPAQLEQIESYYQTLEQNKLGSRILSSLNLLTLYLDEGSKILQQPLQGRPLCFNQTPSPRAKILKNVFSKFFIGEVQPYLARVEKSANPWITQQNILFDHFKALNLPISRHMLNYHEKSFSNNSPFSLWNRYLQAREKHIKSWQKILQQCGMMPNK